MARRVQDIPIRPRYGLPPEATDGDETTTETVKSRKTSTSNSDVSSYKEIPFLAQYAGPVPDSVLNDLTPTATNPTQDDESVEDEDDDEENSKSSSYDNSSKTPKRPQSLLSDVIPYELEGTENSEGQMRHFVAENLEEKLRLASPQAGDESHQSTPCASISGNVGMTKQFFQTPIIPQIDANVLNDIEIEAQYLAASVDNLTENLCNLLHSISSITADNVEVHKNAVNKLTDSMDANIKCMYTIMAKTEEISKSMQPTEQLGGRIS
ncbi:BLOC-1-related complex subunit 6-like isoform X1 [Musca autumnalis]|uniref:BLOC-1-related complex subunit 6-like isoform X1 n=1 Tax=Musca autumnalis TaxID=221902 RepID=UPI003CE6A6C7